MAFIMSKHPVMVNLPGGKVYRIPKGFVGEIPQEVFDHWYVQASIKTGDIVIPGGKKDIQIEAAVEEAAAKKSRKK